MEFKFYCQHCGQHMAATADQVGTQAVCPTCSRAFDVPAPVGFQPPRKTPPPPPPRANVEAQTPEISNTPSPPRKKQQGRNPFAFVGTILATLIILGIRGCFSGGSEASRITKVLNRCVEISHRAAQYNATPRCPGKLRRDGIPKNRRLELSPRFSHGLSSAHLCLATGRSSAG